MVYGVLVMINFAHGDVFMVSSFFCFLLLLVLPVPFIAAEARGGSPEPG